MNSQPIANQPLPAEFLSRLAQIVGPSQYEECLAGFAVEKATTFRVNTLLADRIETCDELARDGVELEPIAWCDSAYWVSAASRAPLIDSEPFRRGHIYVQNASSLLPVLVLDPRPGESILDLAAAPGGKTLHMAAKMLNQGVLSAVEPIRGRMYRLQNNVRLHGVTIVKTYLTDGRTVGKKTPNRFDRVLLDAPCSAESRFRLDDPATWRFWSLRKIREQARKQVGLLRSAIIAMKPGGTLVYCTCSFAPEENECVVSAQRKWFADTIQVEPIDLPVGSWSPGLTEWNGKRLDDDLRHARRILPTSTMDGFFLIKLTKLI